MTKTPTLGYSRGRLDRLPINPSIAALFRELECLTALQGCQSAFKFDPRSASNFDPLWRRVLAVAVAPSELVGVAETARARVVG